MKVTSALCFIAMLCLSFSQMSTGKLLFHDDFEKDALGNEQSKWEVAHEGGGQKANVIKDPENPNNKVMASSDAPSNQARHDAGGSIYVVGDENWTNYVAEWDMMFPDDFYMGVVFRFQDSEAFYLSDRRQGGNDYHFYKRQAGAWPQVSAGQVSNKPLVWYRAQLTLKGEKFTFKLKDKKDDTPFSKINPATEGSDGDFENGRFGNYGLVYLDNIFIGDKEEDLVLGVKPAAKLTTTWGNIKSEF